MDPGYVKSFREIEDSPDIDITDAAVLDEDGEPKLALIKQAGQLQWVLVALCSGSAPTRLRRDCASNGC